MLKRKLFFSGTRVLVQHSLAVAIYCVNEYSAVAIHTQARRLVAYSKPFVPMNQAESYLATVIYYINEAVSTAQQLQEVINMADNEKFTIDRSDLTSGNYDTAEQTAVTTEGEAPVSPPETVIAIILAGLIRSGAVS